MYCDEGKAKIPSLARWRSSQPQSRRRRHAAAPIRERTSEGGLRSLWSPSAIPRGTAFPNLTAVRWRRAVWTGRPRGAGKRCANHPIAALNCASTGSRASESPPQTSSARSAREKRSERQDSARHEQHDDRDHQARLHTIKRLQPATEYTQPARPARLATSRPNVLGGRTRGLSGRLAMIERPRIAFLVVLVTMTRQPRSVAPSSLLSRRRPRSPAL